MVAQSTHAGLLLDRLGALIADQGSNLLHGAFDDLSMTLEVLGVERTTGNQDSFQGASRGAALEKRKTRPEIIWSLFVMVVDLHFALAHIAAVGLTVEVDHVKSCSTVDARHAPSTSVGSAAFPRSSMSALRTRDRVVRERAQQV